MTSFYRMKEDAEEVLMLVSSKLPGKTILWTTFGVFILIIFVLGFGIGYGSSGTRGENSIPAYYFVSRHNESCPALNGERLLTTLRHSAVQCPPLLSHFYYNFSNFKTNWAFCGLVQE